MDPHSLFADPDLAVHLNADPDPAAFQMQTRIQPKKFFLTNYLLYEEFKKTKKIAQQLKTMEIVQISLIFLN